MIRDAETLLGLRVRSRRAVGLVSIGLFVFYSITMSRSLSLYDSPELALVAEQLGLGHPFGQPLHTILGALVARLPGIDPLVALNALSALAGALSVVPATSIAQTLLDANLLDANRAHRFVAPTVGLAGVLPILWEPATRIEVYPLAVFLAAWAIAHVAPTLCMADPDAKASVFARAGVAFGLSASANPICAVGGALGLVPIIAIGAARHQVRPRHLIGILGGGVAGLIPYAYVFAVADRTEAVVWGAPVDVPSILHYFSGADFSPKQVETLDVWWTHVIELASWSLHNGLFAIVVAGLVGLFAFRAPSWLGVTLLVVPLSLFVAFIARNGVFAPDVLDYLGYLALPAWVAAGGLGLLVARIVLDRPRLGFAVVLLIAVWSTSVPPNVLDRSRHRDFYTETLAFEALRAAPPNAILLIERDHWVGPIWYLQEQLGIRRDVVPIAYGLSASTWYWDHVYRRHPDLHPFALRGPEARIGRVGRFLAANPERPLQIERVELADILGLQTCPADWLLDVREDCVPSPTAPALTTGAAAALRDLGNGSPGTDGLLALVAFDRGHDLWRHGLPRSAVSALLAGVPPQDEDIDLSAIPERIEPQRVPAPRYEPAVALGHPARNLHYAALIARATRAEDLAIYFEQLADALGPVTPNFAGLSSTPANL